MMENKEVKWTGENHREMHDFLTNYKKVEEYMESFNENFRINFSKGEGGLVLKTKSGDKFVNIGEYVVKDDDNFAVKN